MKRVVSLTILLIIVLGHEGIASVRDTLKPELTAVRIDKPLNLTGKLHITGICKHIAKATQAPLNPKLCQRACYTGKIEF